MALGALVFHRSLTHSFKKPRSVSPVVLLVPFTFNRVDRSIGQLDPVMNAGFPCLG
jgi:hypothetical protein